VAEARQICPACYRLIPADAHVCPACGADLDAMSGRDFRVKLLAALHHPLDDVRMRAILALGLRGEPETAEALADCALRHPVDVVEGLAVVDALSHLGRAGARALARLAENHPARGVRDAAQLMTLRLRGDANAAPDQAPPA
jgi:HEAT repeat protein